MNHFLIVLIAFVVVVKASLTVESQWLQFKFRHGKSYKNQVEEEARYKIFRNNLRKIEEHNKKFEQGLSTFQMGVTAFADLTEDEFKDKMGLRQNLFDFNTKNNIYKVPKEQLLANSLDWREKGAVTDIKDQQNCGSCWAFSVTGALEGQYQIKHKKLIPLSEQNLIDCTGDYGNQGCKGGKMTWTFQYVKEHGITTEEKYPYVAKMEECRYNESDSILKISGYTSIPKKDENALMSALSKIGPIAVAMDASMSLQLYTKGVFDDPQCSSVMLNHAVLLVGYGQEKIENKTVKYWILKNEWGLFWGEDGYFRLVRGKNACGIATEASYPNIL